MKIDKQIVVTEVDGKLVYSYYPNREVAKELLTDLGVPRLKLETEGLTKAERKSLYSRRYYYKNRKAILEKQRQRDREKKAKAKKLAS